jgi:hypothetical protein
LRPAVIVCPRSLGEGKQAIQFGTNITCLSHPFTEYKDLFQELLDDLYFTVCCP